MIKNSYRELVGHTPMLRLNKIKEKFNLKCDIIAKLEYFNPAGSIKDRVGKELIDQAIKDGLINQETTIIEPTSGNTGIGLAAYATSLNLKVIIVMSESMSLERRQLMKAYGAKLVLTDASEGMSGSIKKANELKDTIDNSFIPSQFENRANPMAHYKTTGPEIWDDTDGNIDILVCGIGTGGTISGTGRYLKEKKDIKIIGVEPSSSPLLTKNYYGSHKIQGIGANFVPKTLSLDIVDDIVDVSDEDAYKYSKELALSEGIFTGISSGAALHAAILEAMKEDNINKTIVVILPDGGDRYLSSGITD